VSDDDTLGKASGTTGIVDGVEIFRLRSDNGLDFLASGEDVFEGDEVEVEVFSFGFLFLSGGFEGDNMLESGDLESVLQNSFNVVV